MTDTVRNLETSRFGSVSYDEKDVIHFALGIPAFEERKSWILLGEEDDPVKWLQSLDDGNLALPVSSPFHVDQGYTLDIPGEDADAIGLDRSKPDRTGVLVVITIPLDSPWEATANMVAPIVVNLDSREARQIVAIDERYSVWHPVLSAEAKAAMQGRESQA